MKAWHFVGADRKLRYDDRRVVKAGHVYKAKGKIVLCKNGMHGSKRLIDAVKYAPSSILCRVDIEGEIKHGIDKIVGRSRKVLWMMDTEKILHEFACRCAEDALRLVNNKDQELVDVIKAKRDWVAGKICDEELYEIQETIRRAPINRGAIFSTHDAAWLVVLNASIINPLSAAHEARQGVSLCEATIAKKQKKLHFLSKEWCENRAKITEKQNRRLTAMICSYHKNKESK